MTASDAAKVKESLVALKHWREWYTFDGANACFRDHLFTLIAKADEMNLAKLSVVFPMEVAIFKQWSTHGDNLFLNLESM